MVYRRIITNENFRFALEKATNNTWMSRLKFKLKLLKRNYMIADDTFRIALDKVLKQQNIIKKDRNALIDRYLLAPVESRDTILDAEESKAKALQKKPDVPNEKEEQIEVVRWFKATYPGTVIMMIRNDGYRTFSERPEQILMGLHPGVSDLYIPAWHCWVEMKRVKGSVWSVEQIEFCQYVAQIGDTYLLCYGAEDAKNQIIIFNLKKGEKNE